MSGYDILLSRGVTRLCHFTLLKSLTHIISTDVGILASNSIRQDTKKLTDVKRYDGELDYVCCTVEYPNSWFLSQAMTKNLDRVFRDWVVIYIDLKIVEYKDAKFCQCNASKKRGYYINDNMQDIEMIFSPSLSTFEYSRSRNMVSACPTDGQAEVLIKGNIPVSFIKGIAVGNAEIAGQVFSMLKIFGISDIDIFISPDVLSTQWSQVVRAGKRPVESKFGL